MQLSPNHISITSQNKIKEICKPLFDVTEICYFIFARFYDDGSHIAFPSDAAWHQYFWSKEYHKKSRARLEPGSHLWHAEQTLSEASLEAKTLFNMDNKLDIVMRGDGYYDIFGFASTANNHKIIDFYFNNMDLLKKFTFYFVDRAHSLIKEGEKLENRLFINEPEPSVDQSLNNRMDNVINRLRIRNFKFPKFSLSERQMQCLMLTLRGRTANDIGQHLSISPKTAESYLESVKNKFNCNSKAELFDKAYEFGIIDLI